MNDLSARDLQRSGGQWTRGKAIDGFLPPGPLLVTADEVPDPQDLAIRCTVNGEVVQDSSTAQMVFGVAELISTISQTLTLEPGDCIATGTPPGVGMAMQAPRFLAPATSPSRSRALDVACDRPTVRDRRLGVLGRPPMARTAASGRVVTTPGRPRSGRRARRS